MIIPLRAHHTRSTFRSCMRRYESQVTRDDLCSRYASPARPFQSVINFTRPTERNVTKQLRADIAKFAPLVSTFTSFTARLSRSRATSGRSRVSQYERRATEKKYERKLRTKVNHRSLHEYYLRISNAYSLYTGFLQVAAEECSPRVRTIDL